MDNHELEQTLFPLTSRDSLTALMACEGIFISGSPGSGKSSSAGKQIAHSMLLAGWGGLVLTAKAEETRTWIQYAKDCKREGDLILFNADGGHCFDILHYEWNRPGRGSADQESIIDLMTMFTLIGKKDGKGGGKDAFFEQNTEKLIRHSVMLLALAGERISIENINRVIESLPTRPGEFEEEGWQNESDCAAMMNSVRNREEELTEEQWSDLDHIIKFFCYKWPSLAPETSSSVEATWAGRADKFLFHPFKRLFCNGTCSFIPEMTSHSGKLIVCDFPVLEFGETGHIINCLMKLVFQRAWLRRNVEVSPSVCMLWQDEFTQFLLPKNRDNLFQQTCRSARIANICLTQNILGLSEALSEDTPGSRTKGFLGNLALKIFMQQNDVDTNTYAANLIGKEYRYLQNIGIGGQDPHLGQNESLLYKLEPDKFSQLRKPDTRNPIAQCVIYQGGKAFEYTKTPDNPDGRNYIITGFSR